MTETTQGSGFGAPTRRTETNVEVTLNDNNPLDLVSSSKTITINDGAPSTWTYVKADHELSVESAAGRQASWNLSEVGLVERASFAGYGDYIYSYLSDSRLKTFSRSDGVDSRDSVIERRLDGDLIIHEVTYPDGMVNEIWTTAAMRRVAKRWVVDDHTVTVGYDLMGRVQEISNDDAVYRFEYDEEGRILALHRPSPNSSGDVLTLMGFEYNLDTQLSSILDASGEERLRYEYDEFGRPVNASGSNYNVSQTYADVSGLLIGYQRVGESAEDNVNNSLTWQGDLLADFITSGAVEGSVSYSYDDYFYRSGETVYWNNDFVSRDVAYNVDGVLNSRGSYSVTRTADSGLVDRAVVGDVEQTLTYNGFGEVVGHAYARISTGEILLEETISRNPAGHLSSRNERWFGSERSFAYAYDSRRRLTGVTGAESYGWEYDVSDNMVALGSGETTVSLEYNYSNQLVDDGDAAYVYDADGQLLSQTNHQTEAERSFVYDAVGQLTEVTLEDGRVIRYVLDPAGNPVKRLVDDVLTHAWVYDANRRPIVEYSAALDKHAFVTYGANEYHPAYLTQDGNDYVVVTDSMGNTRGLVDAVDGSGAQRTDTRLMVVWFKKAISTKPVRRLGRAYSLHRLALRVGSRCGYRHGLASEPLVYA